MASFYHAQVSPVLFDKITSSLKGKQLEEFDKGRHEFNQDYYLDALPHFENIIADSVELPELYYLTGICYSYHIHKPNKALIYFHKAEKNAAQINGFYFNMGFAYERNDSINDAISFYKKALEIAQNNHDPKELINEINLRLIRCEKINEYKSKKNLVRIKNIGLPINSDASEYAPLITSNESMMIFTYRGSKSKGGKQKIKNANSQTKDKLDMFFEDIYISHKINDSSWTSPVPINNLNTILHDAAVSLNPDGTELFVYRNNGAGKGDLYLSKLVNDEYTKPVYQAGLNSHEWDGSACFIPYQNTIIFASERKGGLGGKDLYTAERIKDNLWGNIKNMGPQINTKYDEDAPFVTADGKILFFSSNNQNSLGGYDIFRCDLKNNEWTKPYNLGAPINSKNDDKYFITRADGKVAYYSSYQAEGRGDQDIYKIEPGIPGMPVELLEVNGFTSKDGKAIGAEIEINSLLKHNKFNLYTKSNKKDGSFMVNLPAGDKYEIIVKTNDFPQQIIELNTVGIDSFVVLNVFADFTSPEFDKKLAELEKDNLQLNFDQASFAAKFGNYTKDELVFKVQIAAYKFFENFNYNNVMGFPKIIRRTENDYITRFFMGNYQSYNDALELLNKLITANVLKDSFIIAEYKGQRLYLNELLSKNIIE
ncbi:MAG: PD40 domain-containing protein [Sphingobacteriaceae bacterium]|nr:PD40 domain-containing protein [Sphingobacteriaceae bacterium]